MKKKKPDGATAADKKYPSRKGFKYLAIPAEMADEFAQAAEEEQRSSSSLARVVIRDFLLARHQRRQTAGPS